MHATTPHNQELESGWQHGPARVAESAAMQQWTYRYVKRTVDIVASAVALIALSPLFLAVGILIKCTSAGPVFYPWYVVGLRGKPFQGYKFRTMVKDADELKHQLEGRNEMNGPVFKMKDDPRVTRVGRLLRKYSVDELPQLWSVLKGDMSLVGPRPAGVLEWPGYETWQRYKLSVTPGMTCLWQVEGRNRISDFDQWVRLDLDYIEHWSLRLDFKILAMTILVVLQGTGL